MLGSAEGKTTRRRNTLRTLPAFSRPEAATETFCAPAVVFTTIGNNAATKMSDMAATGLMPKNISVNGTQAVTGTGRMPCIVGSISSSTERLRPIRTAEQNAYHARAQIPRSRPGWSWRATFCTQVPLKGSTSAARLADDPVMISAAASSGVGSSPGPKMFWMLLSVQNPRIRSGSTTASTAHTCKCAPRPGTGAAWATSAASAAAVSNPTPG